MMKLREAAGAINRSRNVFVFVWIDPNLDGEDGGTWVSISKVSARALLEYCRSKNIDTIDADLDKRKDLYIREKDYAEPGATGAGEGGEEEEEDDDGAEEEEDDDDEEEDDEEEEEEEEEDEEEEDEED